MAQYCDPETDKMIKEAVAFEDEAPAPRPTGRSRPS